MFLSGEGQMKLDDEIIPVVAGDAIYIPPHVKHQMLNPSDEWLVHLLVQGNNLDPTLPKQPVTTRNWVPAWDRVYPGRYKYPRIFSEATVSPIFAPAGAGEHDCLHGLAGTSFAALPAETELRHTAEGGSGTLMYCTAGSGSVSSLSSRGSEGVALREGDSLHLPAGEECRVVAADGGSTLELLLFSA